MSSLLAASLLYVIVQSVLVLAFNGLATPSDSPLTDAALAELESRLDQETSDDVRDQMLLGLAAGWAKQGRTVSKKDVEKRIAKTADKLKEPLTKWADPKKLPTAVGRRDNYVLPQMVKLGYITQAQADACCAASERNQSQSSHPTPVTAIATPIPSAGVHLPSKTPTLVPTGAWRIEAPIHGPPVPRHVLLSVFLV